MASTSGNAVVIYGVCEMFRDPSQLYGVNTDVVTLCIALFELTLYRPRWSIKLGKSNYRIHLKINKKLLRCILSMAQKLTRVAEAPINRGRR